MRLSGKTIYDPCPPGWKVPIRGYNGVWSKATDVASGTFSYEFDSTNKGMNFSGKFGSASTIWYPATGVIDGRDGLHWVGVYAIWYSCTHISNTAFILSLVSSGTVSFNSSTYGRVIGLSVRCLQE